MYIKSNEKKEHSAVELVIHVDAVEFEAAIDKAYNKQKKNIMIAGFRKGKAPRKMIEKMYGAEIFYDDAISEAYPAAYEAALKEAGLEPVAYPELEVLEAGKDGFDFRALVTVKPEASIEGYKGLVVAKPEVKVTAADVKKELEPYIERATRLVAVDRKAKKGDVVEIDFEGFKDGVPFEGGKGENYSLELGSGTFVPGFEDQVIGMKAGDEKDIDITFPEDYTPELAGAKVVFKVKAHEVKTKELPTVDDEFAKDVSEFETLDELKKDLSAKLKERRQAEADRDYNNAIVDALIEKLVCDVPQAMVDYRANKVMEDYARRLEGSGIPFDNYLQMMGMTREQMLEQAKVGADREVRSGLALDAIVAAEGITVSDEEADAEMVRLAEEYKADIERVRANMDVEELKRDMAAQKAMDLVKANVKKPAAKKAEKKAEDAADEGEKKPAAKKTAKKAEGETAEKKPAAKKTAKKAEE